MKRIAENITSEDGGTHPTFERAERYRKRRRFVLHILIFKFFEIERKNFSEVNNGMNSLP